ncbi:disease resistance protein RUN1-like isoform X3 [Carya illinoinensis]|uniref:disease resistance protein RUN1-like isoform X3 n=1 Tax=Carya illinoinensis TaxID=32201 RepID=UPI001C7237FE|nr:disease resistance protein RUN1-like isoform X3 [Carya illinoinensis]
MAFQLGASSSSSSPSIFLWNHDVFLSFRESRWCLDELLKILDCKEGMQQILLPIFYHVDPTEVRHQKGIFGESFNKLGDKLKDNAKMEKWKDALETVANLSDFPLVCFRDDESEFIQKIIMWVNQKIVKRMPLNVAKHPIGIESRIRGIYQRLSIERNDIIRVVGIFGTGGIGKTTIANDIYNQISSQFEGSCFLRNIRETSKQGGGLIQLQNTLLSEILGTKLDINDVDRGVNVIRDRLQSKKILLIFDDVDKMVQLEKLVGDLAWFGSGSRVIITTRDQHLLDNSKVDSKYKVRALDDTEALQLFSLYTFEEKEPLKDYVDLSKQVTKYAQGLPLALTVLGLDLKGRNIDQWKGALDKYRKVLHQEIQSVLQISYDSLEDNEKDMFLDIAFFFKGEPLAKVMEIFDSCGFFPAHGIQRLIDKCLITIERRSDECVFMHDLLQDMGREIERVKSSKDPSKRSRLWFHKDVREVLEEDTGPNEIEGIVIDLPEGDEEISLHPEAFRHMKRLRVFINRNARFSCAPNYLPDKLRVLDWYNYPSPYLPLDFQGKKLIVFRMHNSIINKELGERFKLKNLTFMAFESCSHLTEIPDLSSTPNLKELTVRYCNNVVKVHDSVGYLEYLSKLDFKECSKLEFLPRSLKLRSLREFNLAFCSSLCVLPEIECKMESIDLLGLSGTAVEELPLSFGNLVGLQYLYLWDCKNLMRLPIALIQLQYLHFLGIGGCTNIVKKMRDDGQFLDLPNDSTTMEDEISNSRNGSNVLQVSNLQISCTHSESNFFPLYSFFTLFNSSTSLTVLNLTEIDIVSLPTNVKEFITLTALILRNCHKLEVIVELPPNIRDVNVMGCESLERFSEVSKMLEFKRSRIRSLEDISMFHCSKMHENLCNDKVQNPLWWKGLYHDYEMEKEPYDDARYRGIDIEGPHYLEDISGIVLYVERFFNYTGSLNIIPPHVRIYGKGSNRACRVQKQVQSAVIIDWKNKGATGHDIWVGFSNLQRFEQKVLDNLHVQFFFSAHYRPSNVARPMPFYISCSAKVVYKKKKNG